MEIVKKPINYLKRKRRGKRRKKQRSLVETNPSNTPIDNGGSSLAIHYPPRNVLRVPYYSYIPNSTGVIWRPRFLAGIHSDPRSPYGDTSDLPFYNNENLQDNVQMEQEPGPTVWKPVGDLLKNEEQFLRDMKFLWDYIKFNIVGPFDDDEFFYNTIIRLTHDYTQRLLKERDSIKSFGNPKKLKEISDFILEKLDTMLNLFRLANEASHISKIQQEALLSSITILEGVKSQLTIHNLDSINIPNVSSPCETCFPRLNEDREEVSNPVCLANNILDVQQETQLSIETAFEGDVSEPTNSNVECINTPSISLPSEASFLGFNQNQAEARNSVGLVKGAISISEMQQEDLETVFEGDISQVANRSVEIPSISPPSEASSPKFDQDREEAKNLGFVNETIDISEMQQEALPSREIVLEGDKSHLTNRKAESINILSISSPREASPLRAQEQTQRLEEARNEVYMLLEQLSGTQNELEKVRKIKNQRDVELEDLVAKLLEIRASLVEKSQYTELIKESFTKRVTRGEIIFDIKCLVKDNIRYKDEGKCEKVPVSAHSSRDLNVTEYEVHLVTMITSFLRAIPYSVSLDYIYTHVEKIDNSLSKKYVENLLKKYPTFFKESVDAGSGKGWSYLELKPIITI